jgi:uncharacterized membrane protein YdbT with pleckstrin-like domain
MAYYTKVLQPDETVKFIGRLHWIMYSNAILLLVCAVAAAIFSMTLQDNQQILGLVVAGIFLLLAIVTFLGHLFQQWTTEIVVTDKRIIHKHGFIRRSTEEMNISKVESVDVQQSVLGRLLDYGTVMAKGTGQTKEFLESSGRSARPARIASPLELRNAIIVG